MSDSLKALQQAALIALQNYAKGLEAAAIESLKQLSKQHPNSKVQFVSAMGTWEWTVDGNEVEVPASKLFDAAYEEYQYGAIPAPVMVTIEDGKLTMERNW